MSKFVWGHVLDRFTLDFDGTPLDVVKYHPWKSESSKVLVGEPDELVSFHCDELRASFNSMQALVIAWIAYKSLGLNQHALVYGICRALEIKG